MSMHDIAFKLLPLFGAFGMGALARQLGLVPAKYGSLLLKFVFFVTIPPLVFVSVSHMQLTGQLGVFLVLPTLLVVTGYAIARAVAPRFHFGPKQEGVFRAAPMILNTGFILPFAQSVFGAEGVTRIIIFNATNNPLIFIWAYIAVAAFSEHVHSRLGMLRRVFASAPLWALILGLVASQAHFSFGATANHALLTIGGLSGALIVIALGILFAPRRDHVGHALRVAVVRLASGVVIAYGAIVALDLHGADAGVALLVAASPVGFNLLTFSSREKLDESYAASLISYSVALTLLFIPPLMYLATRF